MGGQLEMVGIAALPWVVIVAVSLRRWVMVGGVAFTGALACFLVATRWWAPLLVRFAGVPGLVAFGIMAGICVYEALVLALFACVARWSIVRLGVARSVLLPLGWAILESFKVFPWESSLAVLAFRVWPIIQVAEVGGTCAVSALIVLCGLGLYELAVCIRRREWPRWGVWGPTLVVVSVLLAGWGRGRYVEAERARARKVRVGIVQPNFGVCGRAEREGNGQFFARTLRESTKRLAGAGAEVVVWPESSWPYVWDRDLRQEYEVGHPWNLRGGTGVPVLFGALSCDWGKPMEVYNSAILVGESGRIEGIYDKNHLVPFGEYIPGEGRFPQKAARLRNRLENWPRIQAGGGVGLLATGGLRAAPLICSEDLNSDHAASLARLKPNVLVGMASDAWFGKSAAPWQHLALAVFRAVETRRDFVRCCNTGVSAFIDATGRVRKWTTLVAPKEGERVGPELLLGEVALLDVGTPLLRYHGGFGWLCVVAIVMMVGERMLRRQRVGKDERGE